MLKLSQPLLCAALFAAKASFAQEISFQELETAAIDALEQVQQRSIDEKVEYCGYLLIVNEEIVPSEFERGDLDSCLVKELPENVEIIASVHTHGNHNPDYNSEVPSDADVEGDFEEEVYGFVGTPGGRVWLIDPFQEEIFQICAEQCITQDEDYDAADYPAIPENFSQNELLDFLENS